MTDTDILNGVLEREGGYADDPADHGGPTMRGWTLTEYRLATARPDVTPEQMRAELACRVGQRWCPTCEGCARARDLYRRRYVAGPGFDRIADDRLRAQLVDFGINSGPARALRWLQRAIGVPVTGTFDGRTEHALRAYPARLVNNALVGARAVMVDAWTDGDKTQKRFEEGVESRGLSFFIGEEP